MSIADKIQSLRQTVGGEYKKPDPQKVVKFQVALQESDKALEYLTIERGLSKETIKKFSLGYDKARNAIAIPVFKNGEVINIKYRFLDPDKAKYGAERGCEVWIFNEGGISKGLSKGGVLVVEGEFDCMSAHQAGFENVVSPASGKDSYGAWLELLDNIPRVYIAYDNDEAGKKASQKMAERIGVDKSKEVLYPSGIKDANEYFKKFIKEDFRELIKVAKPYYTYQFKGLTDVIESLRMDTGERVKSEWLPKVEIDKDWLVIISGKSNVGKTSYVMNLADDLTKQKIPVLVMPFERGIESVGKRFLQIKFDIPMTGFKDISATRWDSMIEDCVETPVYFTMPNRQDIIETIEKSKRLFDTRIVIVDHLDYIIRHTSGKKEQEIADTLQELKRVAEDNGIIMIIVTHIRKIESAGSAIKRKPNIEDLKGSSSLYQDPECVAMLTSDNDLTMHVEVVKNKGVMEGQTYGFNKDTGRLSTVMVEGAVSTDDDDW